MPEIKIFDQATKQEFNRFVASHPKGHILQTWEWGEVKRRTGWIPLAVGLMDNDQITAAMLILKRKLPGLRKYIFYAPRGPVATIDDADLLDQLFQGVKSIATQQGAIFLKIDPDVLHSNESFRNYLRSRGFIKTVTAEGFEGVQPTFVFRLDISPDEEFLLSKMSSKTRYNIRLASKKGVTVRETLAREDLAVFYNILQETAERDGFLIREFRYFETIWDQLVENDLARLFMAEYQGRVIAATLAFVLGDKAWYLYGASCNDHRNLMPNYLLQWTMMQWAKNRGCTMYDFRGVSGDLSKDNPLYGLYRFKKGFAGEFTEFIGEWDLVYSPFFYWLWTKALPLYYRMVRSFIHLKRKLAG